MPLSRNPRSWRTTALVLWCFAALCLTTLTASADDKKPITDPGTSTDPWLDDSNSTLGLPVLGYDGDPQFLDDPSLYSADLVGTDPSFGYDVNATPALCQQPLVCRTYSGPPVTPIGVSAASPRYLSYAGSAKVLVGASADAACHFLPTSFNSLVDSCHSDPIHTNPATNYYQNLFSALKAANLNKIRVWVDLAWSKDAVNNPFQKVGGVWRPDLKNQAYFDRLRAVVSCAKGNNIYVEVTFFAPFQGSASFRRSAWDYTNGQTMVPVPDPGGPLVQSGFTDPAYFVVNDTRLGQPGQPGIDAANNERMRTYQKKIVQWTIDELWCYDNVWWEIANEPEDQTVNSDYVAAWQKDIINTVVSFDNPSQHRGLVRPHLIAVQPFTRPGADSFINDSRVAILNAHYTHVQTDGLPTLPNPPGAIRQLNFGMIQMTHAYGNVPKVLGFNEGKITPLTGTSAPRRHVNGVLDGNSVSSHESSRAEAWELLFNKGGILDHWGYLSNNGVPSDTVTQIRAQLSAMKNFMSGLPITRLSTSATTPGRPPAWITSGLNSYPTGPSAWDSTTSSQRYWAALQADPNAATGRLFLLYLHHSTRRCLNDADFTLSGCPNTTSDPLNKPYMAMGGFDARVWTASSGIRYTENLTVDLGPNAGTFDVTWLNPANPALAPLKQQIVAWRQSSCSLPGCIICPGPQSGCTVAYPNGYDFDIMLKISQR